MLTHTDISSSIFPFQLLNLHFPYTQEICFKIFITCCQFEQLNSVRIAAFSSLLSFKQTILEHWEGGARLQLFSGRWKAMGMNQSMVSTDLDTGKRFCRKRTVKQWNRLLFWRSSRSQIKPWALWSHLTATHLGAGGGPRDHLRFLPASVVLWTGYIGIYTFGKGNFGVREQQPAAHTGVSKGAALEKAPQPPQCTNGDECHIYAINLNCVMD